MITKISNSGIVSNATARRAFTATFAFAMILTFGCSSGPDDDTSSSSGGGNGGSSSSLDISSSSDNSSSSSDDLSSSSEDSSSSSEIISREYGSVNHGDKEYKTIPIGEQNWMAENLNHVVNGSKCYDNLPANCEKYGRLYDWATAMALPSNCNEEECADQINTPNHQGICPNGWHIPSNEEWDVLYGYADDTYNSDNYHSLIAGKLLKATSGWLSNGNGIDSLGFAALPGGTGYVDDFYNDGFAGYWISASESDSDNTYYREISFDSDYANRNTYDKASFSSVRCLENQ